MKASVIICTYNRAELLQRALNALVRQTVPQQDFEVIVVIDGSTDDTAAVCNSMLADLPNMRVLAAPGNIGNASAANLGLKEAKADHILFTDDDCIPREDWVERLCAGLDQEPVVAGAIATLASDYFQLCHNMAQFYPFMPGRESGPGGFIAGANMGLRKEVFDRIGPFESGRRLGLDMELILRARRHGYRVWFASDAVVLHDPREARTRLASIFRYSFKHAAATILLRLAYADVLNTPFVLRSPALLLLASPLIALKVTVNVFRGNRQLRSYLRTAPVIYLLKLAWCWGAMRGMISARRNR